MRNLFIILFLFMSVIGYAQVLKMNDNTISVDHSGNITCNKTISDTLILNGDTATEFISSDSITGNIGNSGGYIDTLFSNRILSKKIGLNTLTINSNFDVFGTSAISKNMFNFTDNDINKVTTTFALAIDTSSIYLWYTPLGSPVFGVVSKIGENIFKIDSSGTLRIGANANNYSATYWSQINADNTQYVSGFIRTAPSSSTAGGIVVISSDDGAYCASGDLMGQIIFSSPAGASGSGHALTTGFSSIASFTTETWANGKYGNDMRFYTVKTGTATVVERMRIGDNGGMSFASVAQTGITAAGGITAPMESRILYYNTASAIDITANPQFVDGNDGQIITIVGSSDVNTLTLDDGNGLQLAGGVQFIVGVGDTITLMYITTLDLWVEISRSDN